MPRVGASNCPVGKASPIQETHLTDLFTDHSFTNISSSVTQVNSRAVILASDVTKSRDGNEPTDRRRRSHDAL